VLATTSHGGAITPFFLARTRTRLIAKIIFNNTDKTHPTMITNSFKAKGIVKCEWRNSRHKTKNPLQMKVTLPRNKRPRMK